MKIARKVAACLLAVSAGGGFGILSAATHHNGPRLVAVECRSRTTRTDVRAECKAIFRYHGVLVYTYGTGERDR